MCCGIGALSTRVHVCIAETDPPAPVLCFSLAHEHKRARGHRFDHHHVIQEEAREERRQKRKELLQKRREQEQEQEQG